MKSLSGWAREAKEHWQKYRPKMYNELEANGQLNDQLETAAQRAREQQSANLEADAPARSKERSAEATPVPTERGHFAQNIVLTLTGYATEAGHS